MFFDIPTDGIEFLVGEFFSFDFVLLSELVFFASSGGVSVGWMENDMTADGEHFHSSGQENIVVHETIEVARVQMRADNCEAFEPVVLGQQLCTADGPGAG